MEPRGAGDVQGLRARCAQTHQVRLATKKCDLVLGVGWLAEGFSYLREWVVVVERAENRSILALMRRRLRDDGSLF